MRRTILGAGLILLTSCAVFGQAAAESPAFDVASVKPAEPPPPGMMRVRMSGGPGTPDPGQLTYSNVALKNVLATAYGVKSYQINGPKWLESERYDIVAKIPKGTTKEQFQLMLQNLLAERFKLAAHHETKELPNYTLIVAKGGHKLKESVEDPAVAAANDAAKAAAEGKDGAPGHGGPSAFAPPPPPPPGSSAGTSFGPAGGAPVRMSMGADGMPKLPAGMGRGGMMMMISNGRMRMVGNGQGIGTLTEMLGNQLGRPVVDGTELKGKYDMSLDFSPEGLNGPMMMMPGGPPPSHGEGGPGAAGPVGSASEPTGPTIFTALQEQLGLKLEQRKGPVDLVVIDRAEKVPTEN